MPMKGSCEEGNGPNGEYTIDVEATNDVKYHYTFLEEDGGCFDVGNCYLADYFRSYGRCVVVIDQRVHDIYGDQVHTCANISTVGDLKRQTKQMTQISDESLLQAPWHGYRGPSPGHR